MKTSILLSVFAVLSLVKAEFKCICNVNHPNVPIQKCPSDHSPVNSFMYPKDANNHFHGIVDTSPVTCKPISSAVKTLAGWIPVDDSNKIGFIFKDVGLLSVMCPGNYTQRNDVIIPTDCVEPVHIIPDQGQHFAPITNAPTEKTSATATPTKATTTPTTTTTTPTTTITTTTPTTTTTTKLLSHFPTCRDDVIFSLALNESVEHFGAKTCPDGTPSSAEAVVMEYCGVAVMSHWTQGAKVIDNCDRIPRFTPVTVYISGLLMGRSAIFHSCKDGGIELIQQRCGSPVTLHLEHRLAAFYYVLTWT